MIDDAAASLISNDAPKLAWWQQKDKQLLSLIVKFDSSDLNQRISRLIGHYEARPEETDTVIFALTRANSMRLVNKQSSGGA